MDVTVNGASLAYDVAGTGPAVVLLHVGIADRRMWDPQMEPFAAAGFRVVRYDQRGFGESTLPSGPYSLVGDLRALLDHVEIDRAALVGCSLGGRVALEFALSHPDRVRALVLAGSGLRVWEWPEEFSADDDVGEGGIEAAVERNLRRWVDGPARRPDEVEPAVRGRVGEMLRRLFENESEDPDYGPEEPFEPPAQERLAEIRCPSLVLVGELDQPPILEIAELLAAGIPGARKEIIPGTAHVPNMERPEEFDRLVLDFLAGL